MKKITLLVVFVSSLCAFSLDSMIDSVADTVSSKVSNAVSNKVSDTIDNVGQDDKQKNIQSNSSESRLDKLKELVQMRDAGYLTKEEFLEEKKQLLSK